MRRRTFVTACGAAALAGCFGADTDDESATNGSAVNESATNESAGEEQETLGARDPDPIEFSGSGNGRTEAFDVRPGLTILEVDPILEVTVDVVDAEGDVWRSMDWDLQSYHGLVPVDLAAGQYHVEVRTDRDWTIRVIQPEVGDGDLVTLPATMEGSESDYLGPVDFSEINSAAVSQAGVGQFSLKLYALDGDYLGEIHNQEGIFETTAPIDFGGQGWLVATSSDDYAVELQSEEVDGGGPTTENGNETGDGSGNSTSI